MTTQELEIKISEIYAEITTEDEVDMLRKEMVRLKNEIEKIALRYIEITDAVGKGINQIFPDYKEADEIDNTYNLVAFPEWDMATEINDGVLDERKSYADVPNNVENTENRIYNVLK
jgi:hypothetical protein